MQITPPPPPSRNAPCPCGSGRRYKDCHGAIGASAAADPQAGRRDAALHAALAAQQAGSYAEAVAGYEAVLAEVPDHFDALHMLGVTLYQRGEFARALAVVDRAVALAPGHPAATFNRRLVQTAIERRPVEVELCREVLPRLARFVAPLAPAAVDSPVEIVVAGTAADAGTLALIDAVRAHLGSNEARCWIEPGVAGAAAADGREGPAAQRIDAGARRHPERGTIVFVGTAHSPAAWFGRCAPDAVGLVVDAWDACALLDRTRELAGDGRRVVGLAYADAALAARAGLPGAVLAQRSTA